MNQFQQTVSKVFAEDEKPHGAPIVTKRIARPWRQRRVTGVWGSMIRKDNAAETERQCDIG